VRLSEILGRGRIANVLSLGQGQEKGAKKAINEAKDKGSWVVLQNCHLAPNFLKEIEGLLEEIKK